MWEKTGYVLVPCTECSTWYDECGACKGTELVIGHIGSIAKGLFTDSEIVCEEVRLSNGLREFLPIVVSRCFA